VQQLIIPDTSISCSRFIFGTAALFNAGSRKARVRLLEAAIDHGFTHFDTAPYYGFGTAERDLGEVLSRRPGIGITTKVGIYSPGGESQPTPVVFLRKALGRVVKTMSRATVDFSLVRAKAAIEASLQRLRREHIEIYMLHEPEVHLLATDEWQRWLETQIAGGKIGAYGLALTADKLLPFLQAGFQPPVIQMLDSLDGREADVLGRHGRPMQITYGYVSAARAKAPHASVPRILCEATARNRHGPIIVSTRRPDRLAQYARIDAGTS